MFKLHNELVLQLYYMAFPLLSTGDGVAEALVSVTFTSQSPPPAAQLQAPSQMVAGGRETVPRPPSAGAGQSVCGSV